MKFKMEEKEVPNPRPADPDKKRGYESKPKRPVPKGPPPPPPPPKKKDK